MDFFESILFGILQGLTEFLPVSSSGHLTLFQRIFGITEEPVFFIVMLHVATLFAVAAVFYKDIIALFKPPFNTLLLLIIATIPTVIIMLIIKDYIDLIFSSSFLCFGFLITAAVLYLTEIMQKKLQQKEQRPIGKQTALIMGIAQGIAVIPGISRSGSTICAGLIDGAKRQEVAKFSFLMSIPIIAGSAVVALFEGGNMSISAIGIPQLLGGMAAAFLFGMLAIKFMLRLIQKCNYKWFSLYLTGLFVLTFLDEFIITIW